MKLYLIFLLILIFSYSSQAQQSESCYQVCTYTTVSIRCELNLENDTSWDTFLQLGCFDTEGQQLVLHLYPSPDASTLEIEVDLTQYNYDSLSLVTYLSEELCTAINHIRLIQSTANTNLTYLSIHGCFEEASISEFITTFPSVNEIKLQQLITNTDTLVGFWNAFNDLRGIELTQNVISRFDHTLLQNLHKVERLILNSNEILSLENITFLHLSTLQRIELDYNKINLIHDKQFYKLRELEIIQIQNNELTSLPNTAFEECTKLTQILLEANPLNCICSLSWVSTVNRLYAIDFGAATCEYPGGLITTTSHYSSCVADDQECFDPSIVCEYDCVNTDSSYFCECLPGYELTDNNNIDCMDIDECTNGYCQHSCVNTEGSFMCSCNTGYYISNDNVTCLDINECEMGEVCLYGCVNALGTYYCECDSGNVGGCICEPGTDYCIHNEMCLTDLTYCCPASEYYCIVTGCCIDDSLTCPPVLQTDTSMHVVVVDRVNKSSLVITITELPSNIVCEFDIADYVNITSVEYQNCDIEWVNCLTEEIDSSEPYSTNHSITTLPQFVFSRCIAYTTSSGVIERMFIVTPHFSSNYIATRALEYSPEIVYVLASDGSFCSNNCPSLSTDLVLSSDTTLSLSPSLLSISIQECMDYSSIYGLKYSLYMLEIEFLRTSILFEGYYILNIDNTDFGSTTQEFSLSYPGDQYCPAEFLHGVLWDVTLHDIITGKKCSDVLSNGDDSVGLTRLCNGSGYGWSNVISECYYPVEDGTASKSTNKVVLTLSKESYLSSQDGSCPQSSSLLEYYQNEFSSLSVLKTERMEYFDSLWIEDPGYSIQSILEQKLSVLISANCYSNYWIGKITQNINLCSCQTETTDRGHGQIDELFVCTQPACNCTESGCQCTSMFAGDGVYCGLDGDDDNQPIVDLPCSDPSCIADNCPEIFNPYQEDCNNDSIGDVCQNICYDEVDTTFNLTWVCTLKGNTAKANCIGAGQKASRYCEDNDLWSIRIDTFNCTSQSYSNLTVLNNTAALSLLADVIAQETPVYSGDIDISVNILNDNLNRTQDPDETAKITVVDNTLTIIDQLIDKEVIDILGQTELKMPVAENLIKIVDTHAINIVSQNTSVKFNNFTNLHFETLAIQSGSNLSEPIKLVAENLDFDTMEGDQQPELTLPTSQLNSNENIGIVFFAKKNIGSILFKYGTDVTVGSSDIPLSHFSNLQIVSPLISAQVLEGDKKITTFDEPAQIKLPLSVPQSANTYFKRTCVSITLDDSDTFLTWKDDGLTENIQTTNFVECSALHFTSFAVLVAINGLENQDAALTIISYAGVGISIICLGLCIYIYLVFGLSLLKQAHHFTHFNLILCLLLLFVLFSIGLELPYRENFGEYIPCKIASGLLQYLVLTLFAWMLAEAVIILILMQWPFYQFSLKYGVIVSSICWVVPGIYVAAYTYPLQNSFLTPTSMPLNNTQKSPGYCWIQSRDEYMNIHRHNLVVIIPIIVILLANIILFAYVITKAAILYLGQRSFDKFTRSRRASLSLLRLFLVLTPVLGFLWILGLFNFDPASPFAWVFTILGSLQGFFILFFVVLIRKDIRDSIISRFNRIYTRTIPATGLSSMNFTSKS
ncbi:hypothetical protein LOD99_11695 [Oopsacas minuta]|uniref:Uncharacterized protein n=1 Tax=Oopsacas minuta TaxID=111878 RepID=A0AAV7JLN2_9METZ|nr:hypothetical protein LOD99_11695 [Oopsacas minuta]